MSYIYICHYNIYVKRERLLCFLVKKIFLHFSVCLVSPGPYTSISIHFHPFPSISIHFHPLSVTFLIFPRKTYANICKINLLGPRTRHGPTWTDLFLGPPLVKTRRLRASGSMWGQGSLRGMHPFRNRVQCPPKIWV